MKINFQHANQIISALVLYNFKQLNNIIILRPFNEHIELSSEIVLIYDLALQQWTEVEDLHLRFPETFKSILYCLQTVLVEAERSLNVQSKESMN